MRARARERLNRPEQPKFSESCIMGSKSCIVGGVAIVYRGVAIAHVRVRVGASGWVRPRDPAPKTRPRQAAFGSNQKFPAEV